MRFFINDRYFLSVIPKLANISDDVISGYSCQVMELTHGMGMYPARITDNQNDVVACIVHNSPYFLQLSQTLDTLTEVAEFHSRLIKQWYSNQ